MSKWASDGFKVGTELHSLPKTTRRYGSQSDNLSLLQASGLQSPLQLSIHVSDTLVDGKTEVNDILLHFLGSKKKTQCTVYSSQ